MFESDINPVRDRHTLNFAHTHFAFGCIQCSFFDRDFVVDLRTFADIRMSQQDTQSVTGRIIKWDVVNP